jgi:hypothetical protein
LSKQPHEVVPYKILPFAMESAKKVALSRLKLFNPHSPDEAVICCALMAIQIE